MKILWFSNAILTGSDKAGTGTWLSAMADSLLNIDGFNLGNISLGPVTRVTRSDYKQISQWIIPLTAKLRKDGLPNNNFVKDIERVAKEFEPDLIHIWGTESFYGLLTARNYLKFPALLEMQGLKGLWSRVYSGGLSTREILACIGIKELLLRSTIFQRRKQFALWWNFEKEMICNHSYITVQSPWIEAWIKALNPSCTTFKTDLILRNSFYQQENWSGLKNDYNNPVIFCSAGYSAPFKGFHDAIRAIYILKDKYKTIKLKIAGNHQRKGIRQNGYINWLNKLILKYNLSPNVEWLGPLSADRLVSEMTNSSIMLIPSHVESYCVSMAEAMQLGVPIVSSYTGGTSYLAKDGESALFFIPGDESMCAYQIDRLLSDKEMAMHFSKKGRETAIKRNNPNKIIDNQIAIYKNILKL